MAFVFNVALYRRNACGYGTLKQNRAGNRWVNSFFDLIRAICSAHRPTDPTKRRSNFAIRLRQH
jgi:hypothetical protein